MKKNQAQEIIEGEIVEVAEKQLAEKQLGEKKSEKQISESTTRTLSRVTNEAISEALKETRGNIEASAKLLGISRWVIYNRIKANPELKELTQEIRDAFVNVAENKLAELIEAGDYRAINFYLRTQGKKYGYQESITLNTAKAEDDIDYSKLSDEELETITKLLEKAKK